MNATDGLAGPPAAVATADVDLPAEFRMFHDLRVTAITADARAGAHAIAVMAKAGHASMDTTKRYLRLAGVVFRDEANALDDRMLGVVVPETDTGSTQVEQASRSD